MTDSTRETHGQSAADALLARMRGSPAAEAAAEFEAAFHAVPTYASADLLRQATDVYKTLARADAAAILRGLASHRQGGGDAATLLGPGDPTARLLHRLELLDQMADHAAAASLFEQVWPLLPPLAEYWIAYRMSRVYAALERDDANFLMASLALQIERHDPASFSPARDVLRRLRSLGRNEAAARLVQDWHAVHPQQPLASEPEQTALLALAGRLPRRQAGALARVIIPASVRPKLRARCFGGPSGHDTPYALAELLQPGERPAIVLHELAGGTLFVADNDVAVFEAGGQPRADLSVGRPPDLVRATVTSDGDRASTHAADCALLISDVFPEPNLCHFMLDQATRLALYAHAGVDLATSVVVGPALVRPFQFDIARRLGARRYIGTSGRGRIDAPRLLVLSTCRHLRHAAHLGADWAIAALRRAFPECAVERPSRRLLISRADAGGRRVVNEDTLLDALQPLGFERVLPGSMTVAEQARIFAEATHVVAPHGAALANIVFCGAGTRILEIFHPLYGTYAYAALAAGCGLEYATLIARDGASDADWDNDPALALRRKNECMGNDIRIDPAMVVCWFGTAGA